MPIGSSVLLGADIERQNNMTATGKKMRMMNGLNRYDLHFASHSHKSAEKRKKMGWGKKGKLNR